MMNTVKIVSGCALVISMLALFFAWQAYHQLDQRAEDALARRERALVQEWEPQVRVICDDFDVDYPSTSPETLEELLRPLVKIVEPLRPQPQIVVALTSRNRNAVCVALGTLSRNGINVPEQLDVNEPFVKAQPALSELVDKVTSLDEEQLNSLDRAYAARLLTFSPIWYDTYWE